MPPSLLGEGQAQHAHLGQLGPGLLVEAGSSPVTACGAARCRRRRAASRPAHGLAQGVLLGVEGEVHVRSQPQDRAGDDGALHFVGASVDGDLPVVEVLRGGDPRPLGHVGAASSANDASDSGPAMSTTSSVAACCSSEPRSLSTEDAGCGLPSAGVGDHPQRGELQGQQLVLQLGDPGGASSGSSISGRPPDGDLAGVLLGLRPASAWSRRPGRCRPARCRAGTWRSPSRGSPRRSRFSAGTRTSSKKTSLTSKPPSSSSIGRSVTPGVSIGKTSSEMPRCFFSALGSVRHRQKIQSACWPSVVQVFWPLTTQSSPSRTAVVRRLARSEPASGSEKPWHHQMSRFAVAGRKRSFCSWLPNAAMTGPIMRGVERPAARGRRPAASPRARCGAAAASSPGRPTRPASAARRGRRR